MGWVVEKSASARAPKRYQAYYRDDLGKTRSPGWYTSKAKAYSAIEEQEELVRQGRWVDPEGRKIKVADWIEQWVGSRRKSGNTAAKVNSVIKVHILPKWGSRPVNSIKTLEVRGWVADLQENHTPDTTHTIYATFNSIMNAAVEEDVLVKNPCKLQRGDIAARSTEADVVLSPAEIAALVAVVPARYKALIHLAAWSGMRWGELVGLRWRDVDLEHGVVSVERNQTETLGKIGYGPPKGGKARRVKIDPVTVGVLKAHRRDFSTAKSELIFTAPRGGPIFRNNFRPMVWKPAMKELALDPEPTFHDLRHTHITMLLIQGLDIATVAKRVGHSKTSMTTRYAHSRSDSDEAVVAAVVAVQSAPSAPVAVAMLPNEFLGDYRGTS